MQRKGYHRYPSFGRCCHADTALPAPGAPKQVILGVFYCTGLSHYTYLSTCHCSSPADILSHRHSTTVVDSSNDDRSTKSINSVHGKANHIPACAYLPFSLGTCQPGLTYHSSTSRFFLPLLDASRWLSDFIIGSPPSLAITRCHCQDGQHPPSPLLPPIPTHCPHHHG